MSKGLDALQELMNNKNKIKNYYIISKELKALEIVKKYHITPAFFTFNETYQAYIENMTFYEHEALMSEEEYNLAKEVLNA